MSKAPRLGQPSTKAIVAASRNPKNRIIEQIDKLDLEAGNNKRGTYGVDTGIIKKIANLHRIATGRSRLQVTFTDEYNLFSTGRTKAELTELVITGRGKNVIISATVKRKLDAALKELSDTISGAPKPGTANDASTPLSLDENLYPLALEIFGSDEEIQVWLKEPNVFLSDECPADILMTEGGVERVLTYLSKIESGTYV